MIDTVVFWFGLVYFTHILQDCFTDNGVSEATVKNMGREIKNGNITTKQNKTHQNTVQSGTKPNLVAKNFGSHL